MSLAAFAHSRVGFPPADWEPLRDHLDNVARRAADFGRAFGAAEWGYAAGLWHDLGKYSAAFQRYIRASPAEDASAESIGGRVDHSTAGARHAVARDPVIGRVLAYCIAGHHAGLPDRGTLDTPGTLEARLAKVDPNIADALAKAPVHLLNHSLPAAPPLKLAKDPRHAGFQLGLFTRMVFSSLVDADYLATEAFCDSSRSGSRVPSCGLAELRQALHQAIDASTSAARARGTSPAVMACREQVVLDCIAAATREPGLFTLTVPTGGGKTLASMLFALAHASRYNLRRVVVAAPYTSIIDQNAQVYRSALGDLNVLEHHSNLDPARESPWRRLTSENWDAPVIVTTTVQLLESLMAARPAACRKLHNLARSVILLDEAQMLPVTLLAPILATLRELVASYGCSIVLCTATQPALRLRPDFPIGLPLAPSSEIISDVPNLFTALRRTRVCVVGPRSDPQVVERMVTAQAALTIVNTRRHAAALFTRLRKHDAGALHLSASMCPVHRTVVLAEIRRRLSAGESCRLISTQVIEAGVDVDFPLVLRSMAGLDSIAQSAGRCNREGRQSSGVVEVFMPDRESEGPVPFSIGHARDAAAHVLPDFVDDPLGPAAIEEYFRQHYWKRSSEGWDHTKVLECFAVGPGAAGGPPVLDLNFRSAAERFAMLDESQRGVVIPYGALGESLAAGLLHGVVPTRESWAQLQRLSVNLPHRTLERMLAGGKVSETPSGILVLTDAGAYHPDTGLRPDAESLSRDLLCY